MTQSGQAGLTRHHLVWSPVHSTLKTVFPAVRGYNQAVYSFMDEWGWNIAFVDAAMGSLLSEEEVPAAAPTHLRSIRFGRAWRPTAPL